jgi:hypothetical protein
MTKLIWKLYNQKKITLEVAVELLSQHDRSKEKMNKALENKK